MMDSPEARPLAAAPWLFGRQGLALLALVHHRLGHENEVCELMCRLRQRMPDGRGKGDEEAEMLLVEAQLRVHGTLPPWPAVDDKQTAPPKRPQP